MHYTIAQSLQNIEDATDGAPEPKTPSAATTPNQGEAPGVAAVAAGSPAGKQAREAALHTHVTGIISGLGDEVYPGRCIRAAKEIVALVRAHDRQENGRDEP